MAGGLVALLDDVAGITKLAAASLDDLGAAAGKAGAKAAGVVVDDTAVTPRYVAGFHPSRELPIIGRIAWGSAKNKLLLLIPAALLLSALAPWAVTPLLMLGGAYLCFEGAEKVWEAISDHHRDGEAATSADPAAVEEAKVRGAIRTDLILSAEIVAIALAEVAAEPLATRALVLAVVGLAITAAVYGVVALIVKMDDVGLFLARRGGGAMRAIGRGLVAGMPLAMRMLGVVGTAAMLWVGGGILLHGLEALGWHAAPDAVHRAAEAAGHAAPAVGPLVAWLVSAAAAGVFGLVIGGSIAAGATRLHR